MRKKIVVLGGGVGAMAAVFELTNREDWERDYEITIYQHGWRLGGKGASGRGNNLRIEEHGLHMWFGFYRNAFGMISQCYRELPALQQRFEKPGRQYEYDIGKAFLASDVMSFREEHQAKPDDPKNWHTCHIVFPPGSHAAGKSKPIERIKNISLPENPVPALEHDVEYYLFKMLDWVCGQIKKVGGMDDSDFPTDQPPNGSDGSDSRDPGSKDGPRPPNTHPTDPHHGGRAGSPMYTKFFKPPTTELTKAPAFAPQGWDDAQFPPATSFLASGLVTDFSQYLKDLKYCIDELQKIASEIWSTLGTLPKMALAWLKEKGLKFLRWLCERMLPNPDSGASPEESYELKWNFVLMDLMFSLGLYVCDKPRTWFADLEENLETMSFVEFLKENGAKSLTLNSAFVKAMHDASFASSEQGSKNNMSAVAMIRTTLYMLYDYLPATGEFLWRMGGSMGDVVFAPLYQLFKLRGQKADARRSRSPDRVPGEGPSLQFKFFHRVTKLHCAATPPGVPLDQPPITSIDLKVQAEVKNDAAYDPLEYPEGGLPYWPNAPRTDQLVNGDKLAGHDLESSFTKWDDVRSETLVRGTHFDEVILAIPPLHGPARDTMVGELCGPNGNDNWKKMVDPDNGMRTVRTLAFQFWHEKSAEKTGWDMMRPTPKFPYRPLLLTSALLLEAAKNMRGLPSIANALEKAAAELDMPKHPMGMMAGFVDPFNSWGDMSQVLNTEGWKTKSPPKSTFYFCGPMADDNKKEPFADDKYHDTQKQLVIQMAYELWQKYISVLFPKITPMRDDKSAKKVPEWFEKGDNFYFRANIDPSERYVLSPAKTAQLRLFPTPAGSFYLKKTEGLSPRPHPSAYANLYLAADWTWNYFNQGFFEAATISGRLAAQGLIAQIKSETGGLSS